MSKCAAAVWLVKEISDLNETNLDKQTPKTKAVLWRGAFVSFWTQALTVMCGRANRYPNYVSMRNQIVYLDEAYISFWSTILHVV